MDPFLPPPPSLPPPPPPPMVAMEPPPFAAPSFAQVANPVPVHLPTPLNHPAYSEMITAAITALREPAGSSRQAIAKYIERVYSELPPNHSALLTQHLKRMKNSGHLVMVKHSYKLPGSAPEPQPEPVGNADPTPPSSKRKPGRPPKPKPETTQPQFQPQPELQFQPDSVGQFQYEPFVVPEAQNSAGIGPGPGPESVFASLGLVDAPAGHPPPQAPPPPPNADTPVTKRRPGRPKRINSEGPGPGPARALGVRRPGRPPKAVFGGVVGRPRGRPKRNTTSTVTGKPIGRPKTNAVAIAKKLGRPRGRPAKNAGELVVVPITDNAPATAASNGVVPMPKRRGRPPRTYADSMLPAPKPRGRPSRSNADGVKKQRKLSGKPLGRPRKNALMISSNPPDSQHLAALQDLQGKLEQLKSRVKETANVIRPCLNNETAMAALQDLEAFAANGVNPAQPEPI